MNNKQRRRFLSLLIGGIIALSLGNSPKINIQAAESPAPGKYKTLAELDGKTLGVGAGSVADRFAEKEFTKSTIKQFTSMSDVVEAMKSGKIEAYFDDEPILRQVIAENPELTFISENLFETQFGCIFAKNEKGEKLRDEFNKWLADYKASGELEKMIVKWTEGSESEQVMPDYKSVTGSKGTIKLATTGGNVPFNYHMGTEVVGIDIELVARFCMAKDYKLEVNLMTFDGIIPYVQTGKGDIGCAAISITEERAQTVNFSEDYYTAGAKALVLREGATPSGFLENIGDKFYKTFIKEDRWKLFVQGLINTMIMTILSIIFGTFVGFGVFMLCRKGNKALNRVFALCTWIIQGMPMVVLLMVLYYIIFASSSIDGLYVAVIGFTLTFGAAVFGMLKTGVGAIDRGQYEAAYALGYSNTKTFFRVVFPQALPFVLPSYKSEIVGLIKATAVVGYIAVQDLTKMADIVRSRTYEAFFALISLSIIYFLIEGLIAFLVSRIEININPKRRKREDILKGVKTDD